MTSDPTRSRRYRVVMTSAGFEPGYKGGGPIRSVSHILANAPDDVDITLVTRDRDLGDTQPYEGLSGRWVTKDKAKIFYLDTGKTGHWRQVWQSFKTAPVDLLYLNSLFASSFSIAPVMAARSGLISPARLLIAPRGELSPGALGLKAAKKQQFLKLWRKVLPGLDVTWHASAAPEANDIRANFPGARVVVSQDQSNFAPSAELPALGGRDASFVFVSRISPKKGLDVALSALRHIQTSVTYDIYGPIEDERYWQKCLQIIATLPTNVRVRHRGTLKPAEVRPTFARYDAFLFPTLGENFGHVIAESLSVSCPVICTDQTPWTECLQQGGGWVIGRQVDGSLESILRTLSEQSAESRLEARQRSALAYAAWRRSSSSDSIFDLVRNESSSGGNARQPIVKDSIG